MSTDSPTQESAADAKPAADATPAADAKPAAKKPPKAEGEAAEPKKAKAPEPEVKPEDMALANTLFARIFDAVERQRRVDRALLDEVERGHAQLVQRVRDEAKDMETWEKKALRAVTDFGGAGQLGGGEARLLQLHNRLWAIRELLDDARKLA